MCKEVRDIDIELNRRAYLAGGLVNGTVKVHTDEYFDCDDFYVYVRGDDKTSITVGSGKRHRTYLGYTKLVEHNLDILNIRRFRAGKTPMKFSFLLPRGLPPTYKGPGARIKYWIEAKAEVSWSLNPEAQKEFWVFSPGARATTANHRASDEYEEQKPLEIRIDETSTPLRMRYLSSSKYLVGLKLEVSERSLSIAKIGEHEIVPGEQRELLYTKKR
ncbi:MAG: hypothetical protein R6V83_11265 [Candidatus Thorarchaeota archaeon]